jgi:hypothetical protein
MSGISDKNTIFGRNTRHLDLIFVLIFCHNCVLRVEQTNEEIDREDPEQPYWLQVGELIKKAFLMG